VNALAVNDIPGARGANVKMVDVELGWNLTHEDLPGVFLAAGNTTSTLDSRNHGTAVLGEIRGIDNSFGVRGITPDCAIGVSSAYFSSTSQALLTGWNALDVGDVMLIELHAPGPNATGSGQEGYVPMEYWQDNFDVIQTITAAGGVVVEAAGNGGENLDDPVYGGIFDRNYRDSGAIMVGAGNSSGVPYSWSNNGTRVDLNGWGGLVTTTGYGDLHGADEDEFYTRYFSGTSSASPIVTGSVVALQGMAKANYAFTLDAITIRTLLADNGTPQQPGNIIGPRPDILAAYQELEWGLGEISGVVTDLDTGLPIEGVASPSPEPIKPPPPTPPAATISSFPSAPRSCASTSSSTRKAYPAVCWPSTARPCWTWPCHAWPTVDVRAVVRTETGAEPASARMTAWGLP
jgi:serine protease